MTTPGSRVYAALADTPSMRARWPRFRAGLAAGVLLPESVGPMAPTAFRRDQGRTPICVGEGVGAACAIYARQELGYADLWSPLGLFTLAKEWTKQDVRDTFEGTYSSAAWVVVQALGLMAEKDWPLQLDASGTPVDLDWFKIPTMAGFESMGPQFLPHRLESALDAQTWLGAAGRPFSCIGPVNRAFEALGPGEVWPGLTEDDPSLGLHCQCVHGYTPKGALMLSSWGDGDRIIPWRFFDDGTMQDMTGPLHA